MFKFFRKLFVYIAFFGGLFLASRMNNTVGYFIRDGIQTVQIGYQKIAATYNLPFANNVVDNKNSGFYDQVQVTRSPVGEAGSKYSAGGLEYTSTGIEDIAYTDLDGQKMIIYDDSGLDDDDKKWAKLAAQQWNYYMDEHIWINISEAKKINKNIKATVKIKSVDQLDQSKVLNSNSMVVGEARAQGFGPAQINILRNKQQADNRLAIFEHEMGHAMGLDHIELSDPESADIMSYGLGERHITSTDISYAALIYYGVTI